MNSGIRAIVIHSGGMDSSICLAMAVREHGPEHVLSLCFSYGQRHSVEVLRSGEIAGYFGVKNVVVEVGCFKELTTSALIGHEQEIQHGEGKPANTMVVGRNGFMMRMAAIYADQLGAREIYTGIIEVESANSGYRDCTRNYADRMQEILRMDLGTVDFHIRTPLIRMTKKETMALAHELGVLEYLLEKSVTCYQGVDRQGCMKCPACQLRNEGIVEYLQENPGISFSYKDEVLV